MSCGVVGWVGPAGVNATSFSTFVTDNFCGCNRFWLEHTTHHFESKHWAVEERSIESLPIELCNWRYGHVTGRTLLEVPFSTCIDLLPWRRANSGYIEITSLP
jgi:hypothetical protein